MADEDVIQENMEQTRQALADKLESLERKVSGTVESVTGSLQETVEAVTDSVQKTVETVSGTVESVTDSVEGAVESVKEGVKSAFDLSAHVQNYPWAMVGGSVALGFLAGRLFGRLAGRPRPGEEPPPSFAPPSPAAAIPMPVDSARAAQAARMPRDGRRRHRLADNDVERTEAQRKEAEPGLLSMLGNRFSSELNALKGLALGTTIGVARDMIVRAVPDQLKQEVTNLMDDFTKNLGGKTIHGPVLPEQEERSPSDQPGGWRMSHAG